MDGKRSISDIQMVLIEKFDVPTEQLAKDLTIFLSDLMAKGLVEKV
jgi:hypothetical protein